MTGPPSRGPIFFAPAQSSRLQIPLLHNPTNAKVSKKLKFSLDSFAKMMQSNITKELHKRFGWLLWSGREVQRLLESGEKVLHARIFDCFGLRCDGRRTRHRCVLPQNRNKRRPLSFYSSVADSHGRTSLHGVSEDSLPRNFPERHRLFHP